MPPRKRAAAAPKPEPAVEQEELEASATEESPEGTAEADNTEGTAPADSPEPEPEHTEDDALDAELPCTICFADGWPDGVTARGCEHGTWTRT